MAWSVTRYDTIKQLLTDPRVSRDPRQHWPAWINGEIPQDWPLISWVSVTSAFTSYGPERARLRNLIAKAFTARRTAAMRPRIEKITADLIAGLEATTPGEPVDLRATYAYRLPTQVICDLFGVPEHLRTETLRVIDAALETAATPEQAKVNVDDLLAAMHAIVTYRRETPSEDLTSHLIAAREDESGSQLTEQELVSTLILMIGAGAETAVNLIAKATQALLTYPDQLELLRAGRVSWDDVIEETLRAEGPVLHMPMRYAVEDIKLEDGQVIAQGDPILVAFGAAGRDPARHGADADSFDLTRSDKDHLAFGHGVHFCIGAPLARMEASIALPALFERFPDLSLAIPANELVPQESFIANGHRALPVLLHARAHAPA